MKKREYQEALEKTRREYGSLRRRAGSSSCSCSRRSMTSSRSASSWPVKRAAPTPFKCRSRGSKASSATSSSCCAPSTRASSGCSASARRCPRAPRVRHARLAHSPLPLRAAGSRGVVNDSQRRRDADAADGAALAACAVAARVLRGPLFLARWRRGSGARQRSRRRSTLRRCHSRSAISGCRK